MQHLINMCVTLGVFVLDSADSIFDRLVNAAPPTAARAAFNTACVLGGSIAGLLAAQVLSDYPERVVIIERDEMGGPHCSRPGTPHAEQFHGLLPWTERWLKGFTDDVLNKGATISGTETTLTVMDGQRQALSHREYEIVCATRSLFESCARTSVLRLPNVS